MAYIGPFLFNAVRFALGTAVILPFMFVRRRKRISSRPGVPPWKGLLAGLVLFAGASLQQAGLVYTTAGNAGFVTGLYVVIVPILGIFSGQFSGRRTWLGVFLATAGMYIMTAADSSRMASGDLIVFAGAVFWAIHIQLISRLMKRYDAIVLASVQFALCSLLSLSGAILTEKIHLSGIKLAAVPILYGGIVSVGIAYTLQVIAQKKAHPAHAAIIMSLEAVFALIGGWILLKEPLTFRGTFGGFLMLAAMMVSSTGQRRKRSTTGL